ncbi:MAG: hypothetical protein JRL30_01295 [Deltaproteobacteria bacterium]|nr:hypothetical protein [Deltaproteobacteria bacterium]
MQTMLEVLRDHIHRELCRRHDLRPHADVTAEREGVLRAIVDRLVVRGVDDVFGEEKAHGG